MSTPVCIYCGSADTTDCGYVSENERHIECNACWMGFPWHSRWLRGASGLASPGRHRWPLTET